MPVPKNLLEDELEDATVAGTELNLLMKNYMLQKFDCVLNLDA